MQSSYACPNFTGPSVAQLPSLADAKLLVRRLDGRVRGDLFNSHDQDSSYLLLCDYFGGGVDALAPVVDQMSAAQKTVLRQLATQGGTFHYLGRGAGRYVLADGNGSLEISMEGDLCISDIKA